MADLKAIVDGIFAFLEQKYGAGHPLVAVILAELNQAIDTAGIAALQQYLQSRGLLPAS